MEHGELLVRCRTYSNSKSDDNPNKNSNDYTDINSNNNADANTDSNGQSCSVIGHHLS